MRVVGGLFSALLVVCLSHVSMGAVPKDASKARAKHPKAAPTVPTPARPTGVARKADPGEAYSKVDTVTEFQNDLGQTVYSIVPSHFDVSPPLRDMAAAATPEPAMEEDPRPTRNCPLGGSFIPTCPIPWSKSRFHPSTLRQAEALR